MVRVQPGEPSAEDWASPGFAAGLRAFVEAAVGAVELEQVKLRPWSTVWRATATDGSVFWAKQNCPSNRFEAGLLELLGRLVPAQVVPVVAVDLDRGLLLTPDQGGVLGFEHRDLATWTRIVGEWAGLQRRTAPDVEAMTAVGVDSLPLDVLLDYVRRRVDELRSLPETDPRRLRPRDAERVLICLPAVAEAVDVVGALGLPLALNHNDLHGNNVFARADDAPLRFFDLGDALLADPAFDLLTPLGGLVDLLGCDRDDPRLWRVAEAWIAVWDDVAPPAQLRTALPHAMRLARLTRVEAWWRMTLGTSPQDVGDWGAAGAEWLGALPDPTLLSAD